MRNLTDQIYCLHNLPNSHLPSSAIHLPLEGRAPPMSYRLLLDSCYFSYWKLDHHYAPNIFQSYQQIHSKLQEPTCYFPLFSGCGHSICKIGSIKVVEELDYLPRPIMLAIFGLMYHNSFYFIHVSLQSSPLFSPKAFEHYLIFL
jgi:hypothetical protein